MDIGARKRLSSRILFLVSSAAMVGTMSEVIPLSSISDRVLCRLIRRWTSVSFLLLCNRGPYKVTLIVFWCVSDCRVICSDGVVSMLQMLTVPSTRRNVTTRKGPRLRTRTPSACTVILGMISVGLVCSR